MYVHIVFDIPLSPINWLEKRQEKIMPIANFEEEYPQCSRAWVWLVRHCCAAHRVRGIVIDTAVVCAVVRCGRHTGTVRIVCWRTLEAMRASVLR